MGTVAIATLVASVISLNGANEERTTLRSQVSSIQQKSSQTPRLVYKKDLEFRRRAIWNAPNKIPAGAIVEFVGFNQPLELWRDTSHMFEVPRSDAMPARVSLIGFFGETEGRTYIWAVRSTEDATSGGTVYVYSVDEMGQSDTPANSKDS